jgi:O-acetylhomoserine/O-acetylserine sulfhydrylase-like pyridoxal-dependent enzyme
LTAGPTATPRTATGRCCRSSSAAGCPPRRVFDGLDLVWRATDLGRIKSVATIPAISTHQQQGDAGRALCAIPAGQVRLSVGGEHPDDVIADLDAALEAAAR